MTKEEMADILGMAQDDEGLLGLELELHDGERLVERQHTRGGRCLKKNGGCSCTRAFTVRSKSTGVKGVATAAHCSGLTTFDAEWPEADYGITYQGAHFGQYGGKFVSALKATTTFKY